VFLSAIPEINGSGQEEFLDVDIDRSEFDKYLSGYGANHASSVVMAQTHALPAAGCSYHGIRKTGTLTVGCYDGPETGPGR